MEIEIHDEHRWLEQLIGEWTVESETDMGPGQPQARMTGTESTRAFGGLWLVAEGTSTMPDGGTSKSLMTLGYDPMKKRFVGSFVAAVMPQLWTYDGTLDPDGKRLVLESEGPDEQGSGMIPYRDIIELQDADRRVMRSEVLREGRWTEFMVARYTRKR